MVDITTEIIINRSISDVFKYAVNPEHAPEWYDNIKSAVWESEEGIAVGSRIAFIAHFLGKKLSYTYEIVEIVEESKFTMKTYQGPFPMQTTYTFESIDAGSTLMKLRNNGEPKGFSKLFAPFMGKMMEKANNKDLQKIKSILEI